MTVLCINDVTQGCLYLSGRQFLATLSNISVAEEIAKRECSPSCLGIFGVRHSRHSTEVEASLLCNILENHRTQRSLITIKEKLSLQ